ncbi:hypothetical protein KBC75_04670 [Candidatus Shapirobacteria bacterium]|nr:hypothetical protein [Candidatus Shapirobacteria bacterium]
MKIDIGFKAKGYAIDCEQMYIIKKIEGDRLYYDSVKNDKNVHTISGSIPMANAISSGMRPLLSKEEVKEFFVELGKKVSVEEIPIESKFFRETICLNSPIKIVPILKQLALSKTQQPVGFVGSRRDTFETILKHLTDEFSVVLGEKPEKVREKILKGMK